MFRGLQIDKISPELKRALRRIYLATVTMVEPESEPVNLIVNGDFESWTDGAPDGWTFLQGQAIQNQDVVYEGLNSCELQGVILQEIPLDGCYTVSFWYNGIGGQFTVISSFGGEGAVFLKLDGTWIEGEENVILLPETNGWEQVSIQFTATFPNAVVVFISTEGVVLFDDVRIVACT